jgi:hypothetical protein
LTRPGAGLFLVLAAAAIHTAPEAYAAPASSAHFPVDLVPMIGARGGGSLEGDDLAGSTATAGPSLTFGLAVDVFVRPDGWFEAFIDHQNSKFTSDSPVVGKTAFDFSVDYLQFGGGYEPPEGRLRPFVTVALGLTRFGASSADVTSAFGFSGSLGGGFDVPVGKRCAFRFDVKGYATISDASVAVACGSGCFVHFAAQGWYQIAVHAGLSIRL